MLRIGKIHTILLEAEEEAARLFREWEDANTPPLAMAVKASAKLSLEQTGTGTPGLPPPPIPPPPIVGDGAGPHGQRQATDKDWVSWREWSLIPFLAESFLIQQADAARHMRHFLGNSGQDLTVDVERMLEELPKFRIAFSDYFEHVFTPDIQKEVEYRLATQSPPFSFQYTSLWQFYYAHTSESPNWYHAVGGFSYALGAEVIVQEMGGVVTITINTQTHVFDRYNWGPNKKTDIPVLGEIKDTTLGALHQAGIAREFEIWGQTNATSSEFRFDPVQKWVPIPLPSISQPSR